MNLRFFAIGALAVFAAVAASSDVAPARLINLHHQAAPGTARLYAVGTRSAAQRQSGTTAKMDSVLADLSRHAVLARPEQLLADLHSLSPAARFAQLSAGGPSHTSRSMRLPSVIRKHWKLRWWHSACKSRRCIRTMSGACCRSASSRPRLRAAKSHPSAPRCRAQRRRGGLAGRFRAAQLGGAHELSDASRTGVTVGVLSDSFDCYSVYAAPGSGVPVSGNEGYAYNGFTADYATDVSSGALPSGVDVLEEASCLNYGRARRRIRLIRHSRMKAGRCCRSFTRWRRVRRWRSTRRRTAKLISPAASASWPPPARRSSPTTWGISTSRSFRMACSRRRSMPSRRKGVAYFSAAGNDGDSVLPEHRAELYDGVDQRPECRRASAQFRPHGRDQYDIAPDHRSVVRPGGFHRRGG